MIDCVFDAVCFDLECREAWAEEPVSLDCGGGVVIDTRGMFSNVENERNASGVVCVTTDGVDLILAHSKLIVATNWQEPRPGMKVTQTRTGCVFRVCNRHNQRCWRYRDSYKKDIRIHMELVTDAQET